MKLTIVEDDVFLFKDMQESRHITDDYLNFLDDDWDIFSGFNADVHPDLHIYRVDVFKGLMFLTVNMTVSTVYNTYNKRALIHLSRWVKLNDDPFDSTIDRYMERMRDLRVIMTFPYLVGHSHDMNSSVWGGRNTRYNGMILSSERRISSKLMEYLRYNKVRMIS